MNNFFGGSFNPFSWNWGNLFGNSGSTLSGSSDYGIYANENAMRGLGSNGGIDMPSIGTKASNVNDQNRINWANNQNNTGGWGTIGDWGNLAGNIAQGISAIGGLISANKAYKLANKQFEFNKALSLENLNSAYKQYNTKLGDVARTRSIMETGSDGAFDDWKAENMLSRTEV